MADGEHSYGTGARDPFWVDLGPGAVIAVNMFGSHGDAYQRWLRQNGLYLFKVPGEPPAYAVGVRNTQDPVQYPDYPSHQGVDPTVYGAPGDDKDAREFSESLRVRASEHRLKEEAGPDRDTAEAALTDLLWLCDVTVEAGHSNGPAPAHIIVTEAFMDRIRAVLRG